MFNNPRRSREDITFTDYLDFEFLEVGDFVVDTHRGEIRVVAYSLIILDRHPQYAEFEHSTECLLVFTGVSTSRRVISRYKGGDPKGREGFESDETVIDDFGATAAVHPKSYFFDGVLRDPRAWISWDIDAEGYEIRPAS